MRFLARRRRKILGVGWSNYEKAPPLLLADFQQGGGFFIGIPLIKYFKIPMPTIFLAIYFGLVIFSEI